MRSTFAVVGVLVWASAGLAAEPRPSPPAATPTPPARSDDRYRLPPEAEAFLANAPTLELFSLDPYTDAPGSPGALRGYKVTGRASLTDATASHALAELVLRGIREGANAWPAKCFQPRHGIRVEQGASVLEVVICFECSQVEVYGSVVGDDGQRRMVTTTSTLEPEVTAIFRQRGLTISE